MRGPGSGGGADPRYNQHARPVAGARWDRRGPRRLPHGDTAPSDVRQTCCHQRSSAACAVRPSCVRCHRHSTMHPHCPFGLNTADGIHEPGHPRNDAWSHKSPSDRTHRRFGAAVGRRGIQGPPGRDCSDAVGNQRVQGRPELRSYLIHAAISRAITSSCGAHVDQPWLPSTGKSKCPFRPPEPR